MQARLSYCTNVHPSQTLDDLHRVITHHARAVREALKDAALDVGLYMSNAVSLELTERPARLERVRELLAESGLRCSTFNGFPYGDFHAARVKETVYRPDWSTDERTAYTMRLATLLAELMGEESYGSISSVGCGSKADASDKVDVMCLNLARTAAHFARIEMDTGKRMILALEPEPFCVLETTAEVVSFFKDKLWRIGTDALVRGRQLSARAAENLLRRHVGVCYDCCHQAVEFEDADASLRALHSAGIAVGKVQASSAVEVRNASGLERLAAFDEPRYLHQTFARLAGASLARYHDLAPALAALGQTPFTVARTHFHVPIFWDDAGALGSTQADLRRALKTCAELAITPHIEIETYTWDILPKELRGDNLAAGIACEFAWMRESKAQS